MISPVLPWLTAGAWFLSGAILMRTWMLRARFTRSEWVRVQSFRHPLHGLLVRLRFMNTVPIVLSIDPEGAREVGVLLVRCADWCSAHKEQP